MTNHTSSGASPATILLADDSEAFRTTVRHLLGKQTDFALVGEAEDGEAAVRLASELRPDIVIMDVVMPRLNGIEATRLIRTASPSTRVIALSLHGDEGFRLAMREAGASTYLLKDNVSHELPKILLSLAGGSESS